LRTYIFGQSNQICDLLSIEEIGIEKGRVEGRIEGRAEGLIEGIAGMLDLKFGDAAAPLIAEIQLITDLETLERVKVGIKPAQTLDDVRRIYAPTTSGK